jgi:hypothetical protein
MSGVSSTRSGACARMKASTAPSRGTARSSQSTQRVTASRNGTRPSTKASRGVRS